MMFRRARVALGPPGAWALGMALLAAGPAAAQGIHVSVTPGTQTVSPGAEFDLDLTVSPAGSPFNGFDATLSYDPVALTLMPLSPTSLQQGCLMTGACSAACGNTFHKFSAAGDSATISDVLLCNQISLTGPGQLYRLHFQASNTEQSTQVRIRRIAFYDAGLFVLPVFTADAQVIIGSPVGVGGTPEVAPGLRLLAGPNPAPGAIVFTVEAGSGGEQRLVVHDVAGRLVRTVERGWRGPGTRRVAWDGRDAAGVRVPAGVYLATLEAGDRLARIRVALVR